MEIRDIPLEQIVPNPEQPRKVFDKAELQELASTIQEVGLINPITVEATDKPDRFILEDGERRLRAHKLAGLKKITAVVKGPRGVSAENRLSGAVVANVQRADMNPIEEGEAYKRLHEKFNWPIAKIVKVTGVSAVRIQNRMLITNLDPEIQQLIIEKRFAKDTKAVEALLSITNKTARVKIAKQLAARGAKVDTVVKACARLREKLAAGVEIQADATPSLYYSEKKAGKRNIPIWKEMQKRQVVPSWDVVKDAARKACAVCPWSENPSPDVCGQCPAVDLVAFMVKQTHVKN